MNGAAGYCPTMPLGEVWNVVRLTQFGMETHASTMDVSCGWVNFMRAANAGDIRGKVSTPPAHNLKGEL